jgi:hypothetical protein
MAQTNTNEQKGRLNKRKETKKKKTNLHVILIAEPVNESVPPVTVIVPPVHEPPDWKIVLLVLAETLAVSVKPPEAIDNVPAATEFSVTRPLNVPVPPVPCNTIVLAPLIPPCEIPPLHVPPLKLNVGVTAFANVVVLETEPDEMVIVCAEVPSVILPPDKVAPETVKPHDPPSEMTPLCVPDAKISEPAPVQMKLVLVEPVIVNATAVAVMEP